MQLLRDQRAPAIGLGQRGLGDRQTWFRYGVVSATLMAPLVSRWRALRAAERARALWQASQGGSRWPFVRHADEEPVPPAAQRDVRPGLWLAGVGVGLVAAGAAIYLLARRRRHAEEEPLDVPLDDDSGRENGSYADQSAHLVSHGMNPTEYGEQHSTTEAQSAESETERSYGSEDGVAGSEHLAEPLPPPVPLFVGNARTLTYGPADGDDPPPVEVRVYFATEAQAKQAGYQAASQSSLGGEKEG